jgi:hypothetical protein
MVLPTTSTGFDLTGVNRTDSLIFHANWNNASDGGESPSSFGPAVAAVSSTWAMMLLGSPVGLFGMRGRVASRPFR